MNRTYKISLALFILLIISLAWLESNEEEPINWTPSYTSQDKIPLGAFVFYESWKNEQEDSLVDSKIPPYEYLKNSPINGTYFFLNNAVPFDHNELKEVLNWVSRGNTLFISAYNFGNHLTDTLEIELASFSGGKGFKTRPRLNLVNKDLKLNKAAEFDQDLPGIFFKKIDTLNNTILGTATFEDEKLEEKVNFIKRKFGKGEIYLHTTPQAFSNYFLLKNENYKYTEALLAYFAGDKIIWDAYYKAGKSFFTSPLYILLNNRPLKWAYYFVLISSILFILFEGKRKQRAIPVVETPANKSYEFTETVSQLYLEQDKYHELGLKKISLFLEFIRNNYRLDTSVINEQFYKDLAAKSENGLDDTKDLFDKIFNFQEQQRKDKNEFFSLTKQIHTFKNKHG